MKPKEKLKEIYDEYLTWKENNKGRHFYQYLASNKYTLAFTVLKIQKQLAEECGFSTTSECRKAINELENPNKHLEDSLNAIDKAIKENPEKVKEIAESIKQNWKSVSDKITESTKNSGYSVYIPESAKKSEQQETWQDILKEFEKTIVDSEFMYSSLRQFLVKNFEVPKRK